MSDATPTEDGSREVTRERHVASPPSRLWHVIADPDLRRSFLGGDLDVPLEAGRDGTFRPDDDRPPVPVRVREVDAPRRLAFDWGRDGDRSSVRIDLVPDGDGTRVSVTEVHGVPTMATAALGRLPVSRDAWCLAA